MKTNTETTEPIIHKTIRVIRDTLLRAFLIGLLFGLLYAGVYYGGRGYWDRLMVDRWRVVDEKSLHVLALSFLTLIRFYLVFVLLIPALALHWTLKRLEH